MIKLKSIFAKSEPLDGSRILIVKRAMAFYNYNFHFPELAPSTELRNLFESKKISWYRFKDIYIEEMQPRLFLIAKLRRQSDIQGTITLLSFNYSQETSHRSILKKLIDECCIFVNNK